MSMYRIEWKNSISRMEKKLNYNGIQFGEAVKWQEQGTWARMLKDEQIRLPGNLCKFN